MKKPIPTYAQRSSQRVARIKLPWERSMAQVIRDNFEAIVEDIPHLGIVAVMELLEAERQEHFDAFLDDTERKARSRLDRDVKDSAAIRNLAMVADYRSAPPFEPFKMGSFNSALSLIRSEMREQGIYRKRASAIRRPAPTRLAALSELKAFAALEPEASTTAASANAPETSRALDTSGAVEKLVPEHSLVNQVAAIAVEQPRHSVAAAAAAEPVTGASPTATSASESDTLRGEDDNQHPGVAADLTREAATSQMDAPPSETRREKWRPPPEDLDEDEAAPSRLK